jgi:hypothetical protein
MQQVVNVDDEELRLARDCTWAGRTDESRQSFTWPHAGEPLEDVAMFMQSPEAAPPFNFGLLSFSPQRVETLDLSVHPHARELHTLENGTWVSTRINP